VVNLKVFRMGNILVDEYNLPVNPPPTPALPTPQGPAPTVEEQPDSINVKGVDFALAVSRKTGLITDGSYKGSKIIESGPYLNLVGQRLSNWSLKTIRATRDANEAVINISGTYSVSPEPMVGRGRGRGRGPATVPAAAPTPGVVETSFEVRVDGHGLITTRYTLGELPALTRPLLAEGTHRDPGGYWELGVSYVLTSGVDRLSWQRKGLWSAYPEDHIGRNAGVATREGKGAQQQYGVKPSWPLSQDEKEFILFTRDDPGGRGTKDFRSTKENIFYSSAILGGSQVRLEALSDGNDAVRMEVLPASDGQTRGSVRFIVNNEYNVPNLGWGNWVKDAIVPKPGYTNQVHMRFGERD
jgi:hypothetical protein